MPRLRAAGAAGVLALTILVMGLQSPMPRATVEAPPYATWRAYGGSSDSMQVLLPLGDRSDQRRHAGAGVVLSRA